MNDRQLPTQEWMKQHLGRAYEGEDGQYHLEFVTYSDVLLDMGYIDNRQAYALDRYALAYHVSTRHLGAKTCNLGETMRIAEVTPDELPTLRDLHRFIMHRLSAPQATLLNAVINEIPPGSNLLAVRHAMTAIAGNIERIAMHIDSAITDFDAMREKNFHTFAGVC